MLPGVTCMCAGTRLASAQLATATEVAPRTMPLQAPRAARLFNSRALWRKGAKSCRERRCPTTMARPSQSLRDLGRAAWRPSQPGGLLSLSEAFKPRRRRKSTLHHHLLRSQCGAATWGACRHGCNGSWSPPSGRQCEATRNPGYPSPWQNMTRALANLGPAATPKSAKRVPSRCPSVGSVGIEATPGAVMCQDDVLGGDADALERFLKIPPWKGTVFHPDLTTPPDPRAPAPTPSSEELAKENAPAPRSAAPAGRKQESTLHFKVLLELAFATWCSTLRGYGGGSSNRKHNTGLPDIYKYPQCSEQLA